MSVHVKFNGDQHAQDDDAGRYEDGEGSEYRYLVIDGSGALAIFEKQPGAKLFRDSVPIAVYGPAAWFSVNGDPRTRADEVGGQVRGF